MKRNFMEDFNYRNNNFNLIRLFASFQVILTHLHHNFPVPEWFAYLTLFNGVPIFFTLSGFLIYWSYDNTSSLKNYACNRALRIYPALLCSLLVTVVLLLLFGILDYSSMKTPGFLLWIVTQSTFIHEFTPAILQGFGGDYAPNSALWTISVEVLLYFSIPAVFMITKSWGNGGKTLFFLLLGVLSYAQNQTLFFSDFILSFSDNGYYRIFMNPFSQFMGFFWYFCIGFIVYLNKERIIPYLAGKGGYFLLIYLVYSAAFYYWGVHKDNKHGLGSYEPADWGLLGHFLLVLCIFSVAYTRPEFSRKIMGAIDISYGLYIYHFLVLHSFYHLGWRENWYYVIPTLIVCFAAAYMSWVFVESKALKFKKKSLV